MQITINFGDLPAGVENHPSTSTTNTGDGLEFKMTEVTEAVTNITTPNSDSTDHAPFPEGIKNAQLPHFVQESWKQVQTHLSGEKQSKISYYMKNGEWFIDLDGTKISLQNESAESNPDAGINVAKGNTYFSQPAARACAESKGCLLPTNDLWKAMATFLGGYNQLRDILQIPIVGWFDYVDGLNDVKYTDFWSASDGEYLSVYPNSSSYTYGSLHPNYSRRGLSVRLLDKAA